MPLFPQSFIDDVRLQVDIVQVIQDYVPLKKSGATYKGLCPFHGEKTPSFHVNREKGFFHCFGCGVGGDVFKFIELHEKVGFADSVRLLAQRAGLTLPATTDPGERTDAAEREALLKVHEVAAAYFAEQLLGTVGGRARQQLADRGLTSETIARLGLGFAPATRNGLYSFLSAQGFSRGLLVRSGLVTERETGEVVDRFRGRLMIPICRDSGAIIAFGGRAMDADQQPKYLNSPETPIYVKSRTLYGLHLSKAAIRSANYAVLVEGYFDLGQLIQAGIGAVVASCGTALTTQQAQLLRRYTSKVVLSFDPDAAGQGAAVRSCEMLVAEGFSVNVALLPAGQDPDVFVRQHGREGYQQLLKASQPYLEFLLDRAARGHDLTRDDGRREFLREMLGVAARVPDAAMRDQFADRLAHKARITEDVVRAEIRKAAGQKRTTITEREMPVVMPVRPAERGLIWALVHEPDAALAALELLDEDDVAELGSRGVLDVARRLHDMPAALVPSALLERLTEGDLRLVTGIAAEPTRPAPAEDCVRTLRLMRFDRERAGLQREIDRLQQRPTSESLERIEQLTLRKIELKRRVEAMSLEP